MWGWAMFGHFFLLKMCLNRQDTSKPATSLRSICSNKVAEDTENYSQALCYVVDFQD
ncbi:hypothetical protein PF008_g18846 [Phytophthora fragariae]|uniref:Uncharacterized protein n=1 Tax=Phytophthora fragariae TaxID=53985 RepID=A0A6G0R4F3_9STRA|nr:hypothetical protein PF008_g18846 [Phytophthora fragariae]